MPFSRVQNPLQVAWILKKKMASLVYELGEGKEGSTTWSHADSTFVTGQEKSLYINFTLTAQSLCHSSDHLNAKS